MLRVRQCVAPTGVVCSVLAIMASMRASSIVLGVPDRGALSKPSSRCSTKRARHLPTICWVTCCRAATTLLSRPSAHARTMRASAPTPAPSCSTRSAPKAPHALSLGQNQQCLRSPIHRCLVAFAAVHERPAQRTLAQRTSDSRHQGHLCKTFQWLKKARSAGADRA